MTAESCCARLLDARGVELYFRHFFRVTVFTQPRSKPVSLGRSIFFPINLQFRTLALPALYPALRPAFKVRRGKRSACASMSTYLPAIRRGAPCDFPMPNGIGR